MNEDLKNKIIKDLKKSGFGAEMLVLKTFNSLGWRAEAGKGYFDRDENKSREIDIYAYYSAYLKVNNKFCVSSFFHICAEVKKSEQPWIIFRTYPDRYFQSCAWNNLIHLGVLHYPYLQGFSAYLDILRNLLHHLIWFLEKVFWL